VLIAWENEALLSIKELGKGQFEMVIPSVTILRNCRWHGSTES